MTKGELLRFLEPFDDDIDIWIQVPGMISEKATALRYVPSAGEGYAFVRLVYERVPQTTAATDDGKPQ